MQPRLANNWEIPEDFKDTCLKYNPSWGKERIELELTYLELIKAYKLNLELYNSTGIASYQRLSEENLSTILNLLERYIKGVIVKSLPKGICLASVEDELLSIANTITVKYIQEKYKPPVPFTSYIAKPIRAYFNLYFRQVTKEDMHISYEDGELEIYSIFEDPAYVYEEKNTFETILEIFLEKYSPNITRISVILIELGYDFEFVMRKLKEKYFELLQKIVDSSKTSVAERELLVSSLLFCIQSIDNYLLSYNTFKQEMNIKGIIVNNLTFSMLAEIFSENPHNIRYYIRNGKTFVKSYFQDLEQSEI